MLNLVYGPSMVVPEASAPGPGATKAARVMGRVRDLPAINVLPPTTWASETQLRSAHSSEYVQGVLEGSTYNGFGTYDPAITAQARTCVGAMIQAVEIAMRERTTVGVPCSGFHHAGYASNWGYCTFNGLIIPILAERARSDGYPHKVLIIDGDGHHGDGTENIIQTLKIPGVMNLSGTKLHHDHWADTIGSTLRSLAWDLVLYQAGADAHKDDPYGAGYLTDDDWFHRDTMVFDYCAKERVPLVFNFAGGYAGEKTEYLHYRSVRAAAKSLLRHPPSPAELKATD